MKNQLKVIVKNSLFYLSAKFQREELLTECLNHSETIVESLVLTVRILRDILLFVFQTF